MEKEYSRFDLDCSGESENWQGENGPTLGPAALDMTVAGPVTPLHRCIAAWHEGETGPMSKGSRHLHPVICSAPCLFVYCVQSEAQT